jgi:hypothetical protein
MTDTLSRFRQITSDNGWREVVEACLSSRALPMPSQDDFGTYWVEAGHRIREQVANDRLLSKFLRAILPPYQGGPVTLFRGENQDRFMAGVIGFCWTAEASVATMFAQGLNAVGSGGVLLTATLAAPAIISGPNAHSAYLGEHQFTVDPFASKGVCSVAAFPAHAA